PVRQLLRMVDPPLRHAPAVAGEGVPGDLQPPYPDASPVLHREGDALRRPSRLAGDILFALRARDVHYYVDPAGAGAGLYRFAQCRLAADLDDDVDVPDLRVHALLLPCRRKLVRPQRAVRQYHSAPPHRPSRPVDHDGAQYESDLPGDGLG